MPKTSQFSWEGLWAQTVKLLSDRKVDTLAASKGAIVPRLEKTVKGFVSQQAALVHMLALVEPGQYLGQLMAEAAGLRANKGALTPASDGVDALLTKPLISVSITKKGSDEADALFYSISQALCREPVRNQAGAFEALTFTMGELISCGGIMGIAKLVKLCPGLYVDERATTLLAFIGSLVYYSDPVTLINHLGGLDEAR